MMNTLPEKLSRTHWQEKYQHQLTWLMAITGKTVEEVEADLSALNPHASAEPVTAAMCDHDADTNGTEAELLEILNKGRRRGEIYRCECSALIDYAHTDNYGPPYRSMTVAEITQAVREAINKTDPA